MVLCSVCAKKFMHCFFLVSDLSRTLCWFYNNVNIISSTRNGWICTSVTKYEKDKNVYKEGTLCET